MCCKGPQCEGHYECVARGPRCEGHYECVARGPRCEGHYECVARGPRCEGHYECVARGRGGRGERVGSMFHCGCVSICNTVKTTLHICAYVHTVYALTFVGLNQGGGRHVQSSL